MNKITRTIALIILAFVGIFIGLKIVKGFAPDKKDPIITNKVRGVRVKQIALESHNALVKFSGKISAFESIELFSEVGGVLLNDNFREGTGFAAGETLIKINAQEFSSNLKAQKSQLVSKVASVMGDLKIDFPNDASNWEAFLEAIHVEKPLPALPESKDVKLKRYLSGKGIYNTYYSLIGQQEKLSKFSITAPFNGVLSKSNVKKGTLVRAGQHLGSFINPSNYELETEVSLSDLNFVQKGYSMVLSSDDVNKQWTGKVSRINSVIDPATQMVKVYVKVFGNDLKDGMYLYGEAQGNTFHEVAKINRNLVKNGGVYTVENGVVKHQKVELKYINDNTAIVGGLKSGDQLIADNMKGLFEGLKVNIIK